MDAVEPTKKKSWLFYHFFICLFGMTFFDDFHDFFMTLFFMSLRDDTDFFYLSSLGPRPHIYRYLGGRQRHLLLHVFATSTLEKMTGASPSVRFFGVATSRVCVSWRRGRAGQLAGARP